MNEDQARNVELTSDIVASYVSNNQVAAGDLATLIAETYQALTSLGAVPDPVEADREKPKGAVSARKSLASPDHIISMIDGKPYRMLRRHLGMHGHTPESYRQAYGLPRDYPMTAATYSEQRRAVAHKIGLGRKPAPAPVSEPAAPVRKRRAGTLKAFAQS